MSKSWPVTPLAAAQRAFDLLTLAPAPLAFDCRGITGMPNAVLPLDELKQLLVADETSRSVRDTVWRELVIRARRDGPAWVVAAAGIAMPGLRRMAGMLAKGWHGDSVDRDAELLTGFVARLATVDLDEPRICGRLIDAGARAVKRARDRDEDTDTIRVDSAWSLPPQQPWDHPDWVLARAMAAAVIDPEEHLLIASTRLEDATLHEVASRLGISVLLARAWRRKAEKRLATAIAAGEVSGVAVRGRFHRTRDATARLNGLAGVPQQCRRSATPSPVAVTQAQRRISAGEGIPAGCHVGRPSDRVTLSAAASVRRSTGR